MTLSMSSQIVGKAPRVAGNRGIANFMIATLAGRICALFTATALVVICLSGQALADLPVPSVGALFGGPHRHFCTGTVITGGAGDIVVTAAHCIYGRWWLDSRWA